MGMPYLFANSSGLNPVKSQISLIFMGCTFIGYLIHRIYHKKPKGSINITQWVDRLECLCYHTIIKVRLMKGGAVMKQKYLYVYNTVDEYELPLAVANSVPELAEMVGTTVNCIYSTISHYQQKGLKSRFRKVLLIDDIEELFDEAVNQKVMAA